MTYELWGLVWAAVLGLVMLVLPPMVAASRKGYLMWNAGPRDTPFDKGVLAERLERAFANFRETFAIFAVVVIALAFLHKSSGLSLWGVRLYLAARILYIPLYACGVAGVRSLIWIMSLLGMLMCFMALFL